MSSTNSSHYSGRLTGIVLTGGMNSVNPVVESMIPLRKIFLCNKKVENNFQMLLLERQLHRPETSTVQDICSETENPQIGREVVINYGS